MKKKLSVFDIIADALLCFCCAVASACVIPSAYAAPFEPDVVVVIALFASFALCISLHASKKALPVCAAYSSVLLIYALARFRALVTGARLVWYYSVSLLSLDFSFLPTQQSVPAEANFSAYITEFSAFSAAVIIIIAALLLIKCRSKIPSLLLPVPAFIPAFIYIDSAPALYTVALLLVYWGGVLFGRVTKLPAKKRRADAAPDAAAETDAAPDAAAETDAETDAFRQAELSRAHGVGRAVFLLLLTVLAVLLPLLSPQESFDPVPFSKRRGILDAVGSMRDSMFSSDTVNPKEYGLEAEGYRNEDSGKAFSICSSVPGSPLLRTHSYGRYDGKTWRAAKEYNVRWYSMLRLGDYQQGSVEYLRIRDAYFSERITPYAFMSKYDITPGESFIRSLGKTAYVWVCRNQMHLEETPATVSEANYMRFAKQQYTISDEELKQTVLAPVRDEVARIREECGDDAYRTAQLIAELVKNRCTYSLNPGPVPEGEDFVAYFLSENRTGYCVHFASAATALMQAMEFPARFVIGYSADIPEAEVWTDVPNSASHAWMEVYVKGIGWLPVECTPGFPTDSGLVSEGGNAIPVPTATNRPRQSFIPVEETPEPTSRPRTTRDPNAIPSRSPSATEAAGSGANTNDMPAVLCALLICLGAALLAWQTYGAIKRLRRERGFTQKDSKQAVLAMLRYLGSLKRYGAKEPPDACGLANEAAFSNHNMDEAKAELLKLVRKNQKDLCRHAPLKRFALRWLTFRL